jgi:hypothetical protein
MPSVALDVKYPPTLSSEGIVIGQGGGYLWLYFDFEFPLSARPVKLFSRGPDFQHDCILPWEASLNVSKWTEKLLAADFFNVPQPPLESEYLFYLGLRVGKRKPRFLYWAVGNQIPPAVLDVNQAMRVWLVTRFGETFGK